MTTETDKLIEDAAMALAGSDIEVFADDLSAAERAGYRGDSKIVLRTVAPLDVLALVKANTDLIKALMEGRMGFKNKDGRIYRVLDEPITLADAPKEPT